MGEVLKMATQMTDETTVGQIENEQNTTPAFDDFWLLYPRHVAKKDARKMWDRLTDEFKVTAIVALFDWRKVWEFEAAKRPDWVDFLPHPASWINGERWEDDLPSGHKRTPAKAALPPKDGGKAETKSTPMPDHVKALLAKLKAKPI